MDVRNPWGQLIEVGAIVGWGRRNGNMSSHQVGKVLEILPYEVRRWTYDQTTMPPLIRYRVRAHWTSGSYGSKDYVSKTEASDLFVLDPDTLSEDVQKELATY
jgi:hypothetical protein